MPKPVIAVLYGYCLGGGLELPLACHLRLAAAEGAKIGLPELDLGTVPAWGGSARLARTVGRAHALARELAAMPAIAVREMLRCIVGAEGRSLEESIADERCAVLATFGTPDPHEGMRAFLEKRKPVFNRDPESRGGRSPGRRG